MSELIVLDNNSGGHSTGAIVSHDDSTAVPESFLSIGNTKQKRSRVNAYIEYVARERGNNWLTHNLDDYRDYLLSQGKSAATVQAYVSTVRTGLKKMGQDRDYYYGLVPADTPLLERKAFVDEIIVRLHNAIEGGKVKKLTKQDAADNEHIRLTPAQQNALLDAIPRDSLAGIRDAALIGLALATGLRGAELLALTTDDLRCYFGGQLAVRVRHGKGEKQRLVPYGAESGVLALVDAWLEAADISDGTVFRGVNNKGDVLPDAITTWTFNRRLARYAAVDPHDLRRSYAKKRYLEGMDILAIRDNLGHSDVKTTQGYIGVMDVSERV
ncbi:MAG: tyrosine-type recombinase/integrase, partial [Aggregatilineales bacterium]